MIRLLLESEEYNENYTFIKFFFLKGKKKFNECVILDHIENYTFIN